MKNELKISTISVVCALCTLVVSPVFGAAAVRSLGGVGTYSSASNAATAKANGAESATRGGSMRVGASSNGGATSATRSASSRAATTPRLSIGKYLAGSSALGGGSSVSQTKPGQSAAPDSVKRNEFNALKEDVEQLEKSLESLTVGAVTELTYSDGVLTVYGEQNKELASVELDFATADDVAELDKLVAELADAGYVTEEAIANFVTAEALKKVEDAVDLKAAAADVTALRAQVENLVGTGDGSSLPELQAQIDALSARADELATKQALTDLSNSLNDLLAGVYSKTEADAKFAAKADLAAVATSGSYNDLSDKPSIEGLVDEATLAQVQTALQDAIKGKQDAGNYAAADALAELAEQVAALTGSSASKEVIEALNAKVNEIYGNYATDTEVTDAINAVKLLIPSLDGYATQDYVQGQITTATSTLATKSELQDYAKTTALDSYALKTELPTVPTVVSAFTNDIGYITETTLNQAKAVLQEAIDGKQASGDYATADALAELAEQVEALTGSSASNEVIEELNGKVDDILASYATDTEVTDAINAVKLLIPSLDGYATQDYVQGQITTATSTLATKSELGAYATTEALGAKADKTTVDGLSTELSGISSELTTLTDEVAQKASKSELQDYAKTTALDSYALKTELPTVPTVISAFTNDTGYITETTLNQAKAALQEAIDGKQASGDYATADALAELAEQVEALTGSSASDEVIEALNAKVNEIYGNYATDTEVINAINGVKDLIPSLDGYAKSADLAAVATSGSYNDLSDKPAVITQETLTTELQNYATTESLTNYVTTEKVADVVTNAFENNLIEIPDGSVSAAKLNTTGMAAGEMAMIMANGDGTAEWVSIDLAETYE